MLRPLFIRIALGTLVFAGGIVGCDSLFRAAKIIPVKETPSDAPVSKAAASSYSALEKSVYQQINHYRQSHNLPPLTLDPRISKQARAHSQAMASGRVPFGHQGFEQRIQAISRIIPYLQAAENVAFNKGYSNPGQEAVEDWIKSPGHLTNIEGQYNLTGIGVVKNAKGEYYLTQIFVRRLW